MRALGMQPPKAHPPKRMRTGTVSGFQIEDITGQDSSASLDAGRRSVKQRIAKKTAAALGTRTANLERRRLATRNSRTRRTDNGNPKENQDSDSDGLANVESHSEDTSSGNRSPVSAGTQHLQDLWSNSDMSEGEGNNGKGPIRLEGFEYSDENSLASDEVPDERFVSSDVEDQEDSDAGEEATQGMKDAVADLDEADFQDVVPEGAPEENGQEQIDLPTLQARLEKIVTILQNINSVPSSKRHSRAEYVEQMREDIKVIYGYNDYLVDAFMNIIPDPQELVSFLDANETARPVTLRVNSLKTTRKDLLRNLKHRGCSVEVVPGNWTNVGIQVFEAQVPLGATPEYLGGYYILQAASSFTPVIAMDPQPNETILDMCAAPGGKSSHIAALMQNTGEIISNDLSKTRAKALVGNLHRLGVRNAVISRMSAKMFRAIFPSHFHRVLLDAPCSGSGVIAKDPSVKATKSQRDIMAMAKEQKELLLTAIDVARHPGKEGSSDGDDGVIVYSTCSVLVEENEVVVDYALRKRPNVRLVDTGLGFGKPGLVNFRGYHFHQSLQHCRRFYPHVHNMDGFFVAKLVKTGPFSPDSSQSSAASPASGETKTKATQAPLRGTESNHDTTRSLKNGTSNCPPKPRPADSGAPNNASNKPSNKKRSRQSFEEDKSKKGAAVIAENGGKGNKKVAGVRRSKMGSK